MELEPYDRTEAAVARRDQDFAAAARRVFDLARVLIGPVCTDDARAAMVARAVFWRERNGLTVADLQNACRQLSRPDTLARVRFPADLLAEYAAAVDRAFVDRRRREETARMRAEDERAAAEALPPKKVKELVGKLLKSWGKG